MHPKEWKKEKIGRDTRSSLPSRTPYLVHPSTYFKDRCGGLWSVTVTFVYYGTLSAPSPLGGSDSRRPSLKRGLYTPDCPDHFSSTPTRSVPPRVTRPLAPSFWDVFLPYPLTRSDLVPLPLSPVYVLAFVVEPVYGDTSRDPLTVWASRTNVPRVDFRTRDARLSTRRQSALPSDARGEGTRYPEERPVLVDSRTYHTGPWGGMSPASSGVGKSTRRLWTLSTQDGDTGGLVHKGGPGPRRDGKRTTPTGEPWGRSRVSNPLLRCKGGETREVIELRRTGQRVRRKQKTGLSGVHGVPSTPPPLDPPPRRTVIDTKG